MFSKKERFIIFLGMIAGALLIIALLTMQKYVLVGEFFLTSKGYIIPIIFGSITGGILSIFYIRFSPQNEVMKIKNKILDKRNVEIKSLHNEIEVQKQNIDNLNFDLDSTLKKYFLLLNSEMNFNELEEISENEFILKIYEIAKKVVEEYDFAIVFTHENGILEDQNSYGYQQNDLTNFNHFSSFIKKHYKETGLYYPNDSSITHLLSEEKHKKFDKINQQDHELLFLNISTKDDNIGGMIFEIKLKSEKTYSENDLSIMRTLENIFENYYEGVELNKIQEKHLIDIVEAMISMLEFHDSYTKGHSIGVADISKKMGVYMNLSEEELNKLYLTALLHDIGKIFIDAEILNKEPPLTEEEYNIIKEHPKNGADILATIKKLSVLKESVHYHHERCDSKGYPKGLSEEEIPRNAKIICVADAYDAMINDRPYRKALSRSKVVEEIKDNINTQFCEESAKILLELIEKGILN